MTEPNTSLSDRPVYFFGQKFEYGYLSQWFNCPFAAPVTSSELALTFQTAKQYMMYRKAVLFEDFTVAKKILGTSAPKEQKKLGRQVKSFNQATWEKHREEIVEAANWNKLTNSKKGRELPEKLLATEDRLLVEASPFDRIWGIGFSRATAESNKARWGQNLLGKSLMRVRARLRDKNEVSENGE